MLCAAVTGTSLAGALSSVAADAVDLRDGGTARFRGAGYVVDFTTIQPDVVTSPAALGSLYSLRGISGVGGVEEGFNAGTSRGVPVMPHVDSVISGAMDVTLGEIGILPEGLGARPVASAVFALKINEPAWTVGAAGGPRQVGPNPKSAVSLDEFQIWVADAPIANATSLDNLAAHARLVYDLDVNSASSAAGDRSLLLNDSGPSPASADLYVGIPKSLFDAAGATASSYVYLYSKFGAQAGFEADAGFESWSYLRSGSVPAVFTVVSSVPEASTWIGALVLTSLCGGAFWMRRRPPVATA
ncbi:MAG: hypothetical protein IT580_11080 [Verrucomicrobiales bacterium]|nr:hypothetical protein [Verrucomicrobiales bacterium]